LYLKIDGMLINYIEEKMSIRFCLVQNQINQNNLHPLTQKRKKRPLNLHQVNPKKERIKKQSIASQESKGYNKLTMNSHSMYSSATALQFSYNKNKVKKKEKKKKVVKLGYINERERFTHLMSRILPGEYWTKRVLIGNPHSTHLGSIFFDSRARPVCILQRFYC